MADKHDDTAGDRGLFASTFGCCAPTLRQNTDFDKERGIEADEQEPVLIFDQPQRIQAPDMQSHQRPTTSHSVARSSIWMGNRSQRQSTTRRPSTSTFSGLARPWTSYSLSKHHRPRISAPTDFRHVAGEFLERKPSFRRLELSIYLPDGRLSPLPDFDSFGWSSQPAGLEIPQRAHIRSSTMSCGDDENDQETNLQVQSKPLSFSGPEFLHRQSDPSLALSADNGPGPTLRHDDFGMAQPGLPRVDESIPSSYPREDYMITLPRRRSGSNSQPTTSSQPLHILSPEALASHPRSLTDSTRAPRTSGSLRRSKTHDTVDEAIRELNTIVEERRVSALQRGRDESGSIVAPFSPSHHIPAIAPSMKVRARSETLSDIGSAFRVPLASNPLPMADTEHPLPEHVAQPVSPPPAILKSSTTTRLRTWLRRSVASGDPTTPPSPVTHQQFYQCAPDAAHIYGNRVSTSTVSSVPSLSSNGNSDSSPTGSYPATTMTTVTTPLGFHDPAGYTIHDIASASDADSPGASPLRPSTSNMGKRKLRRVPAFPKRGVSIDTTVSHVSSSSVGTSILSGVGKNGFSPPAYQEVDPLRERDVGVAF